MFLLVFNKLIRQHITAIALWPFIILQSKELKNDIVLLNHERIHLRQQLELLILPFYIWYFLEFMVHYIICRDYQKAYRKISFEQEAYANESDLNYLKNRKMWYFVNYLKNQCGK